MDCKEFRIGNWIEYIHHKNHFSEVWGIEITDGLGTKINKIPNINYKPIPLTEEWLVKFGFTKWKNKNIWTNKGVMIYLHSKDGICYGKANSRTKLKHVHQLQNLYFALTGEELKIKD
jgi:hypothetical protein